MILSIPFEYRIQVIPPKCRKSRYQDFSGTANVEIAEIDGADAPVALQVRTCEDPVKIIDYRLWRDRLWTQVVDNSDGGRTFFASDPVEDLRSIFSRSRLFDKNERECQAEFQQDADRHLFIDGALWVETTEPYYAVSYSFNWTDLDIRLDEWKPNDRFFRADEFEAARELAVNYGDEGERERLATMEPLITVLNPQALKIAARQTCAHSEVDWHSIEAYEVKEALANGTPLSATGICQLCGGRVQQPFVRNGLPELKPR